MPPFGVRQSHTVHTVQQMILGVHFRAVVDAALIPLLVHSSAAMQLAITRRQLRVHVAIAERVNGDDTATTHTTTANVHMCATHNTRTPTHPHMMSKMQRFLEVCTIPQCKAIEIQYGVRNCGLYCRC